jgi:hypothetical protein
MKNALNSVASPYIRPVYSVEQGNGEQKNKEAGVILKIIVALGAVWSLGFFVFHFVRLLLGRRVF